MTFGQPVKFVPEPGGGVPHLDLAVLAAGDDVLPVGRVGEAGHVVEVALLLEHVRLRLPLPHEQLAEARAAEADPVPGRVDDDAADLLRMVNQLSLATFIS